jgi:hypothetical protein
VTRVQARAEPRTSTASWARTGVILLMAVALGIYADEGQRLDGTWGLLPELGTPWVLLGFAAARTWAPRRLASLVAGVATGVIGLAAYVQYVSTRHGVDHYNVLNDGRGWTWLLMALVVGTVAASAALLSAAEPPVLRATGWGFPVGVPLAETRVVLERGGPDPTGAIVVLVVLAAAVSVAALRRSDPWRTLAAAGVWTAAGILAVPLVHVLI